MKTIHVLWHGDEIDGMCAIRVLRAKKDPRAIKDVYSQHLQEDVFVMSDYGFQEDFVFDIIQWHERSAAFEDVEMTFWKINPHTYDLEYSHQPEHTAFVDEWCSDLKSMPEWKPKPKARAKRVKKAVPYKHEPSHIILAKGYGQGD